MEVLLLLTIFLDVHLAVGWNENMLEPVRTPRPPENSLKSWISPARKLFSLMRPAKKYPAVPKPEVKSSMRYRSPWREDESYQDEDIWAYDYQDEPTQSELQSRPTETSCISTALVSSGVTALAILAIVTIMFKVIPYMYMTNSLSPLHMFARAVARAWLPDGMHNNVPPDIANPFRTWPSKSPYNGNWMSAGGSGRHGPSNFYANPPQGRYPSYRKMENSEDYQQ